MKTSNKLVILILLIFFGSIFGSALILKKEYQKLDFDDPFYGLSRSELPAFSAIKLRGDYHGLLEIRPGKGHDIYFPDIGIFDWEVRQDTLYVDYTGGAQGGRYFSENVFTRPNAAAYILAPSISFLGSEGMSCRVSEFTADNFQASFYGSAGGISFKDNTFKRLSAQAGDHGLLHLANDNELEKVLISAVDSSRLIITGQQIDSLEIVASPQANVQLPGALLEKIKQ